MPITFSSPRAQPEVVHFWYQMKAHIFLVANPKFQLQILCSFGDITKYVKLNGIPEKNFLCIFIIAAYPGVHTFFCLWRVKTRSYLRAKLLKIHFRPSHVKAYRGIHPTGLLFHQKSLDMGPTLVKKSLGVHFTKLAKKIVKLAVF